MSWQAYVDGITNQSARAQVISNIENIFLCYGTGTGTIDIVGKYPVDMTVDPSVRSILDSFARDCDARAGPEERLPGLASGTCKFMYMIQLKDEVAAEVYMEKDAAVKRGLLGFKIPFPNGGASFYLVYITKNKDVTPVTTTFAQHVDYLQKTLSQNYPQ